MTMKVLIADDTTDMAEVVTLGAQITWPGCQVTTALDGAQALRLFAAEQPDLVILDTSLPPPDGFEVCWRIRECSSVPIMMVTQRSTTLDKVRALDLGADDYLTEPFDHLELLARLRALVRRAKDRQTRTSDCRAGELAINFERREIRLQENVISLTSTEYRLLEVLMQHAGTVLPHALLLEQVWGPEYTRDTHYLKVFVRRLRQKLGDSCEQPRYIQTEWGVGYRFIPRLHVDA